MEASDENNTGLKIFTPNNKTNVGEKSFESNNETNIGFKSLESNNKNNIEQKALEAINENNWKLMYKALYEAVMDDFGEKTLKHYRPEKKANESIFGDETANVEQFQDETIEKRVEEVIDTTKKRLKEAVASAIGIIAILKAIDDMYEEDIPIRSRAIAETEVNTAGNAATRFAALSFGLPVRKQWITVGDDRVRPSHQVLDREIKDMHEPYSNGLMFPLDPSGSAEEVINCRCCELFFI